MDTNHDFLISDLYFNPNVCHTCKSTMNNNKKCSGCSMISYCSREHQKLHWPSHKPLCKCLQHIKKTIGNSFYSKFQFSNETEDKAIIKIQTDNTSLTDQIEFVDISSIERQGFPNIQDAKSCADSEDLNIILKKEWIQNKFKLLKLSEELLKRSLRNVEKELLLNPKCCFVCKRNNVDLMLCELCFSVNYCSDHLQDTSHSAFCKQLQLLLNVNKYLVSAYLSNFFSYIEKISNFLVPYEYDNDLEYVELSEYTSYYRTLVYLIKFLNFSNPSYTFHIIGASEYECSPCSVYLWENIFHCLDFMKSVHLIFIGFGVISCDQYRMRLCSNCVDKGKEMTIECVQMSYDEYMTSNGSKYSLTEPPSKVGADLLIAYNAGFHEFESNVHGDTWKNTLLLFLTTTTLPIAFTAYTKEEIKKDTDLIRSLASHERVDFNIDCEINAEASEKPRIDPEDGVYFLNKYISCFYCK